VETDPIRALESFVLDWFPADVGAHVIDLGSAHVIGPALGATGGA